MLAWHVPYLVWPVATTLFSGCRPICSSIRASRIDVPAPSIATLRALYLKRRRTLYEHQRWAMDFLGLIRFEPTDTDKLLPAYVMSYVRARVATIADGDAPISNVRRGWAIA
jgi:hypothetical protein